MPDWKRVSHPITKGGVVMKITTVEIDLAKSLFSMRGIDERGKAVLRRTMSRGKLMGVMAGIPPCLVGVEACSGAHRWARDLGRLGHTVVVHLGSSQVQVFVCSHLLITSGYICRQPKWASFTASGISLTSAPFKSKPVGAPPRSRNPSLNSEAGVYFLNIFP